MRALLGPSSRWTLEKRNSSHNNQLWVPSDSSAPPYPSSSSPGRPRPLQPGQQASQCWCQASGEHAQGRPPRSCSCLQLTSSPSSLFKSASTSYLFKVWPHPFTSSINPLSNSLFLLHTPFFFKMLLKSSVQIFFHCSAFYCCHSHITENYSQLWWHFTFSAFLKKKLFIIRQGLFGAFIFYECANETKAFNIWTDSGVLHLSCIRCRRSQGKIVQEHFMLFKQSECIEVLWFQSELHVPECHTGCYRPAGKQMKNGYKATFVRYKWSKLTTWQFFYFQMEAWRASKGHILI